MEYIPHSDLHYNLGVSLDDDSSAQHLSPEISETQPISQATPHLPEGPLSYEGDPVHITSPLKSQGKRKREVADSEEEGDDEVCVEGEEFDNKQLCHNDSI